MSQMFDTVTIVGVGLLGGSLGLGLKRKCGAKSIRGVGRREESLNKALAVGSIDEAFTNIDEAVEGADLVVLCTPAALVPAFLDIIQPLCSPTCVITDVASTKASICRHAADTWDSPRRFIGSHPMAGSEKFGPEHGDAHLYEGAVTFVEEGDGLDPEAVDCVSKLWRLLGSETVRIVPEVHDVLAARTSHVPHIVAAALAQITDSGDDLRAFVGRGFRDTTRIAEGRPEIWRDICLTNGEAIGGGLAEIIDKLRQATEAINTGDGDRLDRFFQDGLSARRKVLVNRPKKDISNTNSGNSSQ